MKPNVFALGFFIKPNSDLILGIAFVPNELKMAVNFEILLSIFLGLGLAASAGFRVFMPLLALSLLGYFDWIPLSDSFAWLGSIPAIITLALATVVEIAAYYIPWVDNLLDTVALPMATLAGTGVLAASITELDPLLSWGLAIIAGGGTAGAIKSANAGTRMISSVKTVGLANPVVSTVETGFSLSLIVLAIFFPVLALLLVLSILYFLYRVMRKFRTKKQN